MRSSLVFNHLARKLRTRRGGARWFSILRYRGQASQRGFRKRPRIGVLVGSGGWAEGATRLKLGGGSSWDSTVRGLHTPRVDSTGVGALFGQKGGGLDRIYALLRFALTSLPCHRKKIRYCRCRTQVLDKKVEAQTACCLSCCNE